jgi:hypothetical protein
MAVQRRERVIVSKSEIPAGYIPMFQVPEPAYGRIKNAAMRREIDSVCLYPNGNRVKRARKFVDAGQVKEWLDAHPLYSERKNVFKAPAPTRVPQTLPGTGATALDAEVRNSVFLKMFELTNAIGDLTLVVQDLIDVQRKAIAAQGDREPFSLSQDN